MFQFVPFLRLGSVRSSFYSSLCIVNRMLLGSESPHRILFASACSACLLLLSLESKASCLFIHFWGHGSACSKFNCIIFLEHLEFLQVWVALWLICTKSIVYG